MAMMDFAAGFREFFDRASVNANTASGINGTPAGKRKKKQGPGKENVPESMFDEDEALVGKVPFDADQRD